jgi:hypothetical protein
VSCAFVWVLCGQLSGLSSKLVFTAVIHVLKYDVYGSPPAIPILTCKGTGVELFGSRLSRLDGDFGAEMVLKVLVSG